MPRPASPQPNRRGNPHDPDTRAAVLAALISGSTIAEVSRAMKIPDSTIEYWRDQAGIGPKPPKHPEWIRAETKQDLGARVGSYLDDILVSLRAQAIHTRDKEWLDRQNAHDLAILHGVFADKAIRLLGALRVEDDIKLPDPAAA